MRFVDTNVLLYAVSVADDERPKRIIADQLLAGRDLVLSVQVLQEFYVQATRRNRSDWLTYEQARDLVVSFLRFEVQEVTAEILTAAMATSDRFHVSYWDAAILEAARTRGCQTVLSEDLSHGQDYDGVRVENPFR